MTINEIRTALRTAFGAGKYRITANNEIHVYGTMPNTNQDGWYLFGAVGDEQTTARIRQLP